LTSSFPPARRAATVAAQAALLLVVGVVGALAVAEIGLRLAHFHYQPFPEVVVGWPDPKVIINDFHPDPDLLWVTRDYTQRLRDAAAGHPAVVFIGDSCVEFSHYPGLTMERLATLAPSFRTGTKLSVPGWSSEQGRTQLARDVLPLHPRVLIVEYGWNDHWDALGPPDAEMHPGRLEVWAAEHFRVVQVYLKARDGIRAHRDAEPGRRVPLARYRENLLAIARSAMAEGIRVVLVTAPSNHVRGNEPAYLQARHLRQLSILVPLHQSYVDATREAARATGAWLCDAARAADDAGDRRQAWFRHDGIHFTADGDRAMAALVSECVARAAQ